MLLCCELRLTLASSRFDDTLYPPSTCEVAHGRDAEELVANFGERLKALAMCPTRIERADEDPDELGQIESDYNGLIELIHLATDHALQEGKTHQRHDLDLELDDEVWDVECRVYEIMVAEDSALLPSALQMAEVLQEVPSACGVSFFPTEFDAVLFCPFCGVDVPAKNEPGSDPNDADWWHADDCKFRKARNIAEKLTDSHPKESTS